jgi:hypothetical protein
MVIAQPVLSGNSGRGESADLGKEVSTNGNDISEPGEGPGNIHINLGGRRFEHAAFESPAKLTRSRRF